MPQPLIAGWQIPGALIVMAQSITGQARFTIIGISLLCLVALRANDPLRPRR